MIRFTSLAAFSVSTIAMIVILQVGVRSGKFGKTLPRRRPGMQ
jgi:hypothetical protein